MAQPLRSTDAYLMMECQRLVAPFKRRCERGENIETMGNELKRVCANVFEGFLRNGHTSYEAAALMKECWKLA